MLKRWLCDPHLSSAGDRETIIVNDLTVMQWHELIIDLLFGEHANPQPMPIPQIKAKYPNAPVELVKGIHANYEDVYRKIEAFADIRPFEFNPTDEGFDSYKAFLEFTEAQTDPQPVLREGWAKISSRNTDRMPPVESRGQEKCDPSQNPKWRA